MAEQQGYPGNCETTGDSSDLRTQLQNKAGISFSDEDWCDPAKLEAAVPEILDADVKEALLSRISALGDVVAIKRQAIASFARGRIAEEDLRYREALAHYNRAIRLDPDNQEYQKRLENLKNRIEASSKPR